MAFRTNNFHEMLKAELKDLHQALAALNNIFQFLLLTNLFVHEL